MEKISVEQDKICQEYEYNLLKMADAILEFMRMAEDLAEVNKAVVEENIQLEEKLEEEDV